MSSFCFRLLCFLLPLGLYAQTELGNIVGLVLDPQKAPVSGAVVELRSLETNVKRDTATSVSGEYNSLPLPAGRYSVTVRHPGFRERVVQLTLTVGQRLQVDFNLEIG